MYTPSKGTEICENLLNECSICGEIIDNETTSRELKISQCTHHEQMHNDCLLSWLKHQVNQGQSMTCPICREEYIVNDALTDLIANYSLPVPPAYNQGSASNNLHYSRHGQFHEVSFLLKYQFIFIFGLLLSSVICILFYMLYDTCSYIILSLVNVTTMMAIRYRNLYLLVLGSFPWAFHAMLIIGRFEACNLSNEIVCTQIFLSFDLVHFVCSNVVACLLGQISSRSIG